MSILRVVRQAFCRHDMTDSRSWPGVIVCRRCGIRRAGAERRAPDTGGKIYFIEALRGLAALQVIVTHAFHGPKGWGIDLFFLVSGFVMVHSTRNGMSPAAFAWRRIARVVPLYWLMTLAVFAVALVAPHLVGATRPDLVELVKSLAFVPFVKSDGLVQPVLFVGWTLNYEMAFYALFALSLFLPRKLGLAIVLTVLVAVPLAGALLQPSQRLAAFYTSPRLLEFAIGMVAACMIERPRWAPLERASKPLATLGAASYALYLTHPFVIRVTERALPHLAAEIVGPILALIVGIAAWKLIDKPMQLALRAQGAHAVRPWRRAPSS